MEGFESSALAELLANKGSMDPMAMLAMMKDKDGGLGGGSGILILLLIILFAGGGFGLGGQKVAGAAVETGMVDRAIASQTNYQLLMEAINTNGTRQEMAIQNLSNTLGCDISSLKTSMCGLSNAVALLDGKVGYMGADIKNAIQSCCCTMQTAMQAGFCSVNTTMNAGFNSLDKSLAGLTSLMQSNFCEVKQMIISTDKDNQIRALQNEIDEGRQAAVLAAIAAGKKTS